jgi:Flp pilus assembly pilin Flp
MKKLLVKVWLDERCEDAANHGLFLIIIGVAAVTAVAAFRVEIETAWSIAAQQLAE